MVFMLLHTVNVPFRYVRLLRADELQESIIYLKMRDVVLLL